MNNENEPLLSNSIIDNNSDSLSDGENSPDILLENEHEMPAQFITEAIPDES